MISKLGKTDTSTLYDDSNYNLSYLNEIKNWFINYLELHAVDNLIIKTNYIQS